MNTITSAKNPLLQDIRRAAATGRPLDDGRLVIEGPHLLEEVLTSKWRVEQVLVTAQSAEKFDRLLRKFDGERIEIPARAFEVLSATETTQQIVGLVRPRESSWNDVLRGQGPLVVLDGVQDPGNAGTILRSAEAFGASGAVLLEGCVRLANGKLLRATAGSIFRLPCLERIPAKELLERARQAGRTLYALSAQDGLPLEETNLRTACALVTGSEAHGVTSSLRENVRNISIATERVESLNAAVACSIALFEAARQRRRA